MLQEISFDKSCYFGGEIRESRESRENVKERFKEKMVDPKEEVI